jgi:hypothetical protein
MMMSFLLSNGLELTHPAVLPSRGMNCILS